jgi:murein DD-endopeptidase MepM/ murein hydrolase activator NlpD
VSLQLALPLRRPADQMRIIQPFGVNPEAYAAFGVQGHNGIDFDAADGELVVAVDEGEVVEVRFDPTGYGVTVKLSHRWGESRYAHGQLSTVPIEFELGHVVRQGDRIFLAGCTGCSTATHLHFALRTRNDAGALDYTNAFRAYEDPLAHLREALDLPPEPVRLSRRPPSQPVPPRSMRQR